MSARARQEYRVGTGASVLLLIFLVVCLSALGMLALLSARADLTLSRRSALYAQAYYAGQDRAERVLADIASDTAGLDDAGRAAYAAAQGYGYADGCLSFAVSADFERQILITLGFAADGGVYQVANSLENTGEWDAGTLLLSD